MICIFFFFFNDTATTEIYTLSLHDALPISCRPPRRPPAPAGAAAPRARRSASRGPAPRRSRAPGSRGRYSASRSEEHTPELPSRQYLVCRLLLEKKTSAVRPARLLKTLLRD